MLPMPLEISSPSGSFCIGELIYGRLKTFERSFFGVLLIGEWNWTEREL